MKDLSGNEVTMRRFDGRQLEILVDHFWNLEEMFCPHDGVKIWAQLYSQLAGYLLVLGCPRCGMKAQVTHYSDPMRWVFRKWTESEECDLAHDHACGKIAHCPVCRTQVKCRIICEQIHVFECPRCGNQHKTMSFINEQSSWLAANQSLAG